MDYKYYGHAQKFTDEIIKTFRAVMLVLGLEREVLGLASSGLDVSGLVNT
jgi:hypothetical protein